jgi:DNA-binding GntR family transcriptional regulator
MLQPLKHGTAADSVEAALFAAICDGTLPPGAPLRLQHLADELRVSMMPVREAVRRLAAMELVDLQPNRGAWVRELSVDDMTATYEARLFLEPTAVRAGAEHFDDVDARRARAALDRRAAGIAAGELMETRNAHEEFHFALYEACRNPWFVRAILPPWRNAERYRIGALSDPEMLAQRGREHEEMLAAMIDHDGAAAERVLIAHITGGLAMARARLDAA